MRRRGRLWARGLALDLNGCPYYFKMTAIRAVNSAVECHLHTVEAAGSTPAPPTTFNAPLEIKTRNFPVNPKPHSPPMSKRRYLHLFILAVLGLLVYSNAFGSPFVYDDKWFILENVHIRDLASFLDLSGTRYVTLLSFALNYAVGGYEPFGYNLVNIVIHIINAMLVYSLVSLILATPAADKEQAGLSAMPFICSLIFLVHPIETQAVNYISQRFASLATLFYLLSVTTFLRARLCLDVGEKAGGKRYLFYAISLVAAVVAQKTKEISFTLPFVIVSFEFIFFSSREDILKRFLRLIPFLITLAIIPLSLLLPEAGGTDYAFTTSGSLKQVQLETLSTASPYEYLMTQFRVIVTYIRLLLFPMNQNLAYAYPKYNSLLAWQVFVSLIFLASIFFSSVYWLIRSKRKGDVLGIMLSVGILWFFVTISTESSVIPLINVIFEHRLYLPSVGFFIALSAAFLYIVGFLKKPDGARLPRVAWVVLVAVVIILSFLSYKRNIVWSSELMLWKDVTLKNPGFWGAHNNLGLAYDRAGDSAKAKEQFKEAIRIKPEASSPYANLGRLYFSESDYKNALFYYKEALKLDKGNAQAHNNIANLYKESNDTKSALYHYREALRLKPFSDEIIFNLAGLYKMDGDIDEAIKGYNEAIRLAPGKGLYRYALGVLYQEIEDMDNAIVHLKEAVRVTPGLVAAHESLAAIHYARGSYDEAVLYFKRALALSPGSDNAHYNLATAYRDMGNEKLAKRHYLESIRLNPLGADAHYNLGLIYLGEKKEKQAKQEFIEALRISPGFKAARKALDKLVAVEK